MNAVIDYGVAGLNVTTHGAQALKIEGKTNTASTAAALFVQVHDSQGVAAEGAEPIASWPVSSGGGEFYKLFDVGALQVVNGLYVCLSTTEATKTIGTGNDNFSMVRVELDKAEETVTKISLAGGGTVFTVWADTTSPKLLRRVQCTFANTGATKYLHMFGYDNPQNGDVPIGILASGDNKSVDLDFGVGGKLVMQVVNGVIKTGCTLVVSTTKATLTAVSGNTISAEYV